MATAAQIAANIAALESFLASNMGVASVQIDGMSTRFDRAQAVMELDRWRREQVSAAGSRPVISRIRLSGGF